jgi:hypothetical protein
MKVGGTFVNRCKGNRILLRFGEEEILSFAQKTWKDQPSVARNMVLEALNVIFETYQTNPTFFGGRSTKGIVGGGCSIF